MTTILFIIGSAIVGFVIGALVFRNNATAINKDISTVQSDASKVETAATAVATDVKKV